MIRFLIIIPCEKETEKLQLTLDSIQQQNYKNYSVVVVLTSGKVRKKDKINYVVKPQTKGNPSLKRNFALSYLLSFPRRRESIYIRSRIKSGMTMMFLDDDVVLEKNWLKNATKLLKEKKVVAVCGPLLTPINGNFWESISGHILESNLLSLKFSPQKIGAKKNIEIQDCSCAAFAIKFLDFLKLKGFDEKYFPGEDTKLCLDISEKLHKKIIYSPQLLAYHKRKKFGLEFLQQISRYGFQRGKFCILFPKTSLHLIYFLPGLFVIYLLFLFLISSTSEESLRATIRGVSGFDIVRGVFLLPLIIYFFLLIYEVVIVYRREKRLEFALLIGIGIVLTHVVYGINFLRGIVKVVIPTKR